MALTGAEKARRYRARRKGQDPGTLRTGRPPGVVVHFHHLDVTCWCESAIVRVPRRFILEGRTESCGNPNCRNAA